MFDRDRWHEILEALSQNKWRTFLTAFGVGWGMALLIIMMGAGKGLENGITRDMGNWATNSMFVWTQSTTIPYKGFGRGRHFNLTIRDAEAIQREIPQVYGVAPRANLGGYRGSNNVVRGDKTGAFTIYGDIPFLIDVEAKNILEGRWMNEGDIQEKRKICVIGNRVKEMLFSENEDVIGQYLKINGVYFQIVGIFETTKRGDDAEEERQSIYLPLSTFQQAFNWGENIGWMSVLVNPGTDVETVENQVHALLRKRHDVHPQDERAIGGWNMKKEFDKLSGLFMGINGLSLIVSLFSLLAGAIGVSNIMLVVVRERTRELGVRRAVGATPWSVVSQIVQEAVVLTLIAGMVGIGLGVWLMEGIDMAIGESVQSFLHPTVELPLVLFALLILVIVGVLAGILPASRAVKIKPVEALRAE